MKSWSRCIIFVCLGGMVASVLLSWGSRADRAGASESGKSSMIAHDVYFALKDSNDSTRAALVEACKKYLVDHPGVVFFACGTRSDLDRPVNDRAFDVGLHMVFKDRAAHDQYQVAPAHLKFIAENRESLASVRVFDSDVEIVPVK